MKDHDTCACMALTNSCDLHQPTVDKLGERMQTHSKLTEIRMESSKECQYGPFRFSIPAMVCRSVRFCSLAPKGTDSSGRIELG